MPQEEDNTAHEAEFDVDGMFNWSFTAMEAHSTLSRLCVLVSYNQTILFLFPDLNWTAFISVNSKIIIWNYKVESAYEIV